MNKYLEEVDKILAPDLIIIGGGASNKHDKFMSKLTARCPVVPAQMQNDAGIIGAALAAKGR